jgi:SHS2 domain-containing protein
MAVAGYEYLDHPADIQIHSWGPTIEQALGPLCLGLLSVMVDPAGFQEVREKTISIKANDLFSLVYQLLDEWLFIFDTDDFVLQRVEITKCDLDEFEIEAIGYGDTFDMEKHSDFRRTEVKAITYASMKVDIEADRSEVYVIVDL